MNFGRGGGGKKRSRGGWKGGSSTGREALQRRDRLFFPGARFGNTGGRGGRRNGLSARAKAKPAGLGGWVGFWAPPGEGANKKRARGRPGGGGRDIPRGSGGEPGPGPGGRWGPRGGKKQKKGGGGGIASGGGGGARRGIRGGGIGAGPIGGRRGGGGGGGPGGGGNPRKTNRGGNKKNNRDWDSPSSPRAGGKKKSQSWSGAPRRNFPGGGPWGGRGDIGKLKRGGGGGGGAAGGLGRGGEFPDRLCRIFFFFSGREGAQKKKKGGGAGPRQKGSPRGDGFFRAQIPRNRGSGAWEKPGRGGPGGRGPGGEEKTQHAIRQTNPGFCFRGPRKFPAAQSQNSRRGFFYLPGAGFRRCSPGGFPRPIRMGAAGGGIRGGGNCGPENGGEKGTAGGGTGTGVNQKGPVLNPKGRACRGSAWALHFVGPLRSFGSGACLLFLWGFIFLRPPWGGGNGARGGWAGWVHGGSGHGVRGGAGRAFAPVGPGPGGGDRGAFRGRGPKKPRGFEKKQIRGGPPLRLGNQTAGGAEGAPSPIQASMGTHGLSRRGSPGAGGPFGLKILFCVAKGDWGGGRRWPKAEGPEHR